MRENRGDEGGEETSSTYTICSPATLLSSHSLSYPFISGLHWFAEKSWLLLFFLFLHTFLDILSAIVVYCRLNKVSGFEWAVVWRWSNCVAVCICFCVQGSIASIICPHNVMCVLGDFYMLSHLFGFQCLSCIFFFFFFLVFILSIVFITYCLKFSFFQDTGLVFYWSATDLWVQYKSMYTSVSFL